jgi:hypothetical protein
VNQLNKKFLILTLILAVVIVVPSVIATVTYQLTIQVNGTTKYPHNLPPPSVTSTPTPSPAPSQTVKFSLFYTNGTACPSSVGGTLSGGGINTVVVDPMTGHNAGWIPTCIVVQNDGNVPIRIDAVATNINLPSDLQLSLVSGWYGTISGGYGSGNAADSQPIQPGQCYYMALTALINPTSYNYTPDKTFSYSYTVEVTATQA